ncbi:uncharacterized protein PITG_16401 [Phytophthora infestans T30-4]|uniref:Uncharacterized protein n=1 Tax=Phytophthora infestans (strain T30-4) TaxID=403677 RepID=D0NTJ9_PHYIT|nr:uncharacterized protein PITG_16401 [Phytophthora infestans T30-4]EEY64961.1 hypothetical protein PITG_16401 [Phytophthora infestans T30-4]|eukprot:XP_002897449.1 hypothetical protein PITG_16401 [Phytophthora infestans T30-4]
MRREPVTVAKAKQSKAIDGLGHFVLWLITFGGVDADERRLLPWFVVLFAQSLVAGLEAQASTRGAPAALFHRKIPHSRRSRLTGKHNNMFIQRSAPLEPSTDAPPTIYGKILYRRFLKMISH